MSNDRKFTIQHVAGLRGQMVNAFNVAKQYLEAGTEIEVIIRERKSKRSVEQNKRLWEIYRTMAALIWINGRQYSDEVWHEQCKRQFIGIEEFALPDGTIEKRGISSTKLNVGEFGEYMDRIVQWCAEQGFDLGLGG